MRCLIGFVTIGFLVALGVGEILPPEYRPVGLILMGIPVLVTFYLVWVRASKLFHDHPYYRDKKTMQFLVRQNVALDHLEEKCNELQKQISMRLRQR